MPAITVSESHNYHFRFSKGGLHDSTFDRPLTVAEAIAFGKNTGMGDPEEIEYKHTITTLIYREPVAGVNADA